MQSWWVHHLNETDHSDVTLEQCCWGKDRDQCHLGENDCPLRDNENALQLDNPAGDAFAPKKRQKRSLKVLQIADVLQGTLANECEEKHLNLNWMAPDNHESGIVVYGAMDHLGRDITACQAHI